MTCKGLTEKCVVCNNWIYSDLRCPFCLQNTIKSYEDQFVWLSQWCRTLTGVENNKVIGRDGWPYKLVEVVAKAVDNHIAERNKVIENDHDSITNNGYRIRELEDALKRIVKIWEESRRTNKDDVNDMWSIAAHALKGYPLPPDRQVKNND